jgi:sulfatase modifying factor 1
MAGASVNAQTITQAFGSGAYSFSMQFVTIGNQNNPSDPIGSFGPVGAVPYIFNLGKYEVSRDMVLKASTAGGLGLTLRDMTGYGGNGLNKPATGISWYEAARFVNWLNTSKGYQAAYLFDGSGNFQLWSPLNAKGDNLYRHKDAFYFLPSIDEWHKGAYGSPSGAFYKYATGSNNPPTPVNEGTNEGSTVYEQNFNQGPADITNAGGLSPFGTMAQDGNVFEWMETARDGINDSASENRGDRSLSWFYGRGAFGSDILTNVTPLSEDFDQGFRVAMIPEPSSLSLFLAGWAVLMAGRRRCTNN